MSIDSVAKQGDLALIRMAGEMIASTIDLNQVIRMLHEHLNLMMDAQGINIYVHNKLSGCLESRYKAGDYKFIARDEIPVDSATSFSALVFRTEKPIVINDFLNEYTEFGQEMVTFYHEKYVSSKDYDKIMHSFINLPMRVAGETVGVFNVYSFSPNSYTKAHREILEVLASYVAIALHNIAIFGRLESAKKVIEEKNRDITDSLTYAKRIQDARLPLLAEFTSALPESFVLFKPKDIVSGDFYRIHRNDSHVLIVVADCTGHGVPAALISMLCSEQVDKALAQHNDLSEVLSQLNRSIKVSLRQTGEDSVMLDGMDIACCDLDLRSGKLLFAGAYRPLWLIRKGSKSLEEIMGTRASIGGQTSDNQHFDVQEVQLAAGDRFYLFSDGYADSFNGKTHKKLTTRRFRELLLSIQDIPVRDQAEKLERYMNEWNGDGGQMDDVLVVGVGI
jgi:serine phosphatase RsbU (regulator of sigma subunit)